MEPSSSNIYNIEIVKHDEEFDDEVTMEEYEIEENLEDLDALEQEEGSMFLQRASNPVNATGVIWTMEATTELLRLIDKNFVFLNNKELKKRNKAFQNICNSLNELGYTYTKHQCMMKWRSLLRTYKIIRKKGVGPTRFNFYDQICKIFKVTPTRYHLPIQRESPKDNCEIMKDSSKETCKEENTSNRETNAEDVKLYRESLKQSMLYLKREEYKKREQRHKDRLAVARISNNLCKRKLALIQLFLSTKNINL